MRFWYDGIEAPYVTRNNEVEHITTSSDMMSAAIPWDDQATLIDLDGTAPFIGTLRDCVRHFAAFKPAVQADARVLLTKPVFRVGRKTRVWVLNPNELARLAAIA